jgi:hypothetical protein
MHFYTIDNSHCERPRRLADLRSLEEIFGRLHRAHADEFARKFVAPHAGAASGLLFRRSRADDPKEFGGCSSQGADRLPCGLSTRHAVTLSLELLAIDSVAPHLFPTRFPADAHARRGFPTAPSHS